MLLAQQIARHMDTLQDYEDQVSNTHTCAVQESFSELDDRVAKVAEIRRKQHREHATPIDKNAAVTQLLKLAINGPDNVCALAVLE